MIDYPSSYEIKNENPLKNDIYTVAYVDAILASFNYDYNTYFRSLNNIQLNTKYQLPSGNVFSITEQWIVFIREGKKELRVIHAKNKKNASITINTLLYHPDGWELCVTWKKRWICKKEDGKILTRHDIIWIFSALEKRTVYLSPEVDSTGKKRWTILEVKLENK
jgi:hypothetical protein